MNSVLSLVRPDILALKPYASARSLALEADVYLDANESPWPLLEDAPHQRINRYPEPQPRRIVENAAALYGVPKECVMVLRGADEAIEVLTRAVCEAGQDAVLVCPPTYGVYETAARIQGAAVAQAPLIGPPDFRLDVRAICAALPGACPRVKIVYVCSPNNPTGTAFDLADVRAICRAAAGRAIVVVDEAYQEFSQQPSAVSMLGEFEGLAVLRTLSKAWGLAGVRCGFVLATASLIALLQRVRAPYPISSSSIQVVESLFNEGGARRMRRSVERLIAERQSLVAALSSLRGVELVFPSQANFVLARVKDKRRLLAAAGRARLLLRDRSFDEGLARCLRVTVGAPAENDAAIRCFREALG